MPGTDLALAASRRLVQPAVVLLCAVAMGAGQFVVARSLALRDYADTGVIAANGFGLGSGGDSVAPSSFFEQVTSAQLAVYAKLTGALGRHDGLAGVLHEYIVVVVALGTIALLLFGRQLGVALVGCVAAAAVAYLTPALAGLQAVGVSATIASTWVLLSLALLVIRPQATESLVVTVILAAAAMAAAVVTAPISVLIPVALAGALVGTALVGAQWPRPLRALVLVIVVVGLGALGWLTVEGPWRVAGPALSTATDPWLAIGGLAVAALALWRLSWLRPLALVTVPLLAAALWSSPVQAAALVLVAPLTAILLVELVTQQLDRVRAAAPLAHRRLALPVVAVLAVTALATAVIVLPNEATAGADSPHNRLADWIDYNTAPSTVVAVPAVLWAELVHDGVSASRLRITAPGTAVTAGAIRADSTSAANLGDALLASFGSGPDGLAVRMAPEGGSGALTEALTATLAQSRFGAALSVNPNITAADPVQEMLRAGAVDPRLLTVLAGAAALTPYELTDLPANSGDAPAGGMLREAVITASGNVARLSDFFALQLTDYLPLSITRHGSTLWIVYSVPSPVGLIG